MAVTRISDVVVPEVFTPYMLKETKVRSALFQAGVFRDDANMSSFLAGGGRTANVPFWKDLVDTESNPASDNPASDATPLNITSGTDIARRQIRTQGWGEARLSGELAGDDPMQRIGSRVADYWVRQFQSIMVSSLRGVFADNIANDSGDMVNNIGLDAVGTPTTAELVSAEAIIDTKQTMGDAGEDLSVIMMHSVVYSRLQKQNLIDFIPDSNGVVRFPTYLGYMVVVDDGCPVVAGTNQNFYWTFLMGRDSIAWNEVPVRNATAIDNDESAADGMGVEELWTRRQFVMHPYGIKWTDTTVTAEFPTNAELLLAANWDRVYPERKQIPMALLQTHG